MAKIEGSYIVTERDYVEAQDEHVGTFTVKATRGFGVFSIALGLATLLLRPHAYGFVALFSFVGLWSIFGRNFIFRRWYRRDIRYTQGTRVSMSDEGVSFVSQGFDASCHWSRLLAQSESENLFLLYPTERIFYIVPKIAFQPGELGEVQELLTRNVARRHVPWFRKPWGCSTLLILLVMIFSLMFLGVFFSGEQPGASDGVVGTQRA